MRLLTCWGARTKCEKVLLLVVAFLLGMTIFETERDLVCEQLVREEHEQIEREDQAADVFLMWPDTEDAVQTILDDMRTRASGYDRELKFGYRAHVIVRETEAQARAAADQLVSKLDAATGEEIRNRSLDSQSIGVSLLQLVVRCCSCAAENDAGVCLAVLGCRR